MQYQIRRAGNMNKDKLKLAEEIFLMHYPGGFQNPEMLAIAKKHKVPKMIELTKSSLSMESFEDPIAAADAIKKIIARSSMVSVFEKAKFRDLVNEMSDEEKNELSAGMRELLHGNQEEGFNRLVEFLEHFKMAKWTMLTACLFYSNPVVEVFIKPTTTKGIIKHFELEGLEYRPKPSYGFYKEYRKQINEMKSETDEFAEVHNAGFCGFLMMAMDL